MYQQRKAEIPRQLCVSSMASVPDLLLDMSFISNGGVLKYDYRDVCLNNTCNVDGVLMVLQYLNMVPKGRKFLTSKISGHRQKPFRDVLEHLRIGGVSEAKYEWWTELLKRKPCLDIINMLGNERENGLAPLFAWFPLLRVKKCRNNICKYFRNDNEVSIENPDTELRNIGDIYLNDFNQVLECLSGFPLPPGKSETRCRSCRCECDTSFRYTPEDVLLIPLCDGSMESDVPSEVTIFGSQFCVFAYSLFENRHPLTSHYYTVFKHGQDKFLYDGLQKNFRSHGEETATYSVSSVWLLRL